MYNPIVFAQSFIVLFIGSNTLDKTICYFRDEFFTKEYELSTTNEIVKRFEKEKTK